MTDGKIFLVGGLIVAAMLGLFMIAALWFESVHGSLNMTNATNATREMLYGDRQSCGYITNTTTLESLRNCFRD